MGEEIGVNVAVESKGTGVNVVQGIGVEVFVGGTEIGVQATNKTRRKIQKLERFMKLSILSITFSVL